MQEFFKTLPRNFIGSYRGYNIFWHLCAIFLTYLIVISGIDWWYFVHTQNKIILSLSVPAIILGGLLPVFLPLYLLFRGKTKQNKESVIKGWAIGQAALLGYIVSTIYKAFTGRVEPDKLNTLIDSSHQFLFGFLKHGVFWGWPSSHTTIAFAMSTSIIILYPKNKGLKLLAGFYAFYVGFAVATSIHWFSEFVAGALIGTVVGIVVSKSFLGLLQKE